MFLSLYKKTLEHQVSFEWFLPEITKTVCYSQRHTCTDHVGWLPGLAEASVQGHFGSLTLVGWYTHFSLHSPDISLMP